MHFCLFVAVVFVVFFLGLFFVFFFLTKRVNVSESLLMILADSRQAELD